MGQPVRLREWQQDIIRGIYGSPTRRAVISFGRKNAKALALDTPIPTPSGWRTLRDVRAGDAVFGSDGCPARVLAESVVFFGKPCYRLSFSDGSSVVASGDHLWTTKHRYRPWDGVHGRPTVAPVTTEQIAASLRVPRETVEFNHSLGVAGALQTPDVDLPLDPYMLGAWLGDGTSACAAMSVGDEDLDHFVDEVRRVVGGDPVRRRNRTVWRLGLTTGRGGSRECKVQPILRRLGVLNNKHVPHEYLWASTEQRRALLQGLMDTDGTVTPTGRSGAMSCSFTTMSRPLADGVLHLARSMGLKATLTTRPATLYGRVTGDCHFVQFTAWREDAVFRLPRKAARLLPRPLKPTRASTIKIVGCEPVESVPTKCLMVDAPDSLFLVGEGLTPTHNTTLAALLLLVHLAGPKAEANSQLFSAAQSRDQAALLFALAAKIVRMSPDLRAAIVVKETAKQLIYPELGSVYRALSAESSTAYGLSPVFVVHDELGQVVGPRFPLYEALETAAGAQDAPLSIVISTQAPTDADLLSLLIDDAASGADPKTKLFLFTAPKDLDPFSEEAMRAANPAYGDFLNAEEVRSQAEAARRMPAREAAYRNLVLNQRVNMHNPLIAQAVWAECGGQIDEAVFRENPVFAGIDLSARNDLTALVLIARDDDGVWHVKPEFWTPEEGLADRAHRDRVPYDVWAKQGLLHTTPGASVDFGFVGRRLAELSEQMSIRAIAFDRWRMDYLIAELTALGIDHTVLTTMRPETVPDGLLLVKHGQGYQDMPPAIDSMEAELLNKRIRHGGHAVLTWNAANAVSVANPAGERKLEKSKSTGRIDGIVALAMAVRVAMTFSVPDEGYVTGRFVAA